MSGIGDVFVEQSIIEKLVASINVWYMKINTIESNTRHYTITPEEVSHKFNIGVEKAEDTLRVKTQKIIIHTVHTLHRRYRVHNIQLNSKLLNLQFYTDYLLAKTKSLEGNMGAWIYATRTFTLA